VKTAAEDWHVSGTNIGGWLVLEPWITPSLFYQFLGSDKWAEETKEHTGMDTYTFCAALGPTEGNKQLRRHWAAWVTEVEIAAIASTGASHIRVPIGDWMYEPYGPFIGCTDGALDELDRLLALADKHKLKVLLDIHAVRHSQNGFDNSGQALRVEWQTVETQGPPEISFQHWPLRAADWPGRYDTSTGTYPSTTTANSNMTLSAISKIVNRYVDAPAVWGLEPVNEPWQMIPIEWIKQFYWEAYWIVRRGAPHWRFVMHDSFRGYPAAWWDFMKGCPMKAIDTHIYLAWNSPGIIQSFYAAACSFKGGVRSLEDLVDMPVIVGEWSLATDNCAMWLNGFNDNLPGYPKVSCEMKPCAPPYMGYDQPGCPPEEIYPLQGPYGTGVSGPEFGKCPVGVEWGSKEDEAMTTLTAKQLHSFNSGHGWIFWNFRTELEPRWSFIVAYDKGWFPAKVNDRDNDDVVNACIVRTCEDQLANNADGSTCGQRINWLTTKGGLSEAAARVQVGREYPSECGFCAQDAPPQSAVAEQPADPPAVTLLLPAEPAAPSAQPGSPWGVLLVVGACAALLVGGLVAAVATVMPRALASRRLGGEAKGEWEPVAALSAAAEGGSADYVPM